MSVQELLEKGHEEVLKALEGISDLDAENLHILGNWTIRDLLGNLTAYEHVLEDIFGYRMVVFSTGPYLLQLIKMGPEEFDKFHFEEFKYTPYTEVLTQFTSRHQHVVGMLWQMTDDLLHQKGVLKWYDKKASVADYIANTHCPRKLKAADRIFAFRKELAHNRHKPSKKSDL